MFSGGWMLARGPALPLTLLPPEACAHKNDHARTKSAPPTDLKSRGKKAKHTVHRLIGHRRQLSSLNLRHTDFPELTHLIKIILEQSPNWQTQFFLNYIFSREGISKQGWAFGPRSSV